MTCKHSTPRRDLHAEISAKIVAMIDAGSPGTFQLPWRQRDGGLLTLPRNYVSQRLYSGGNVICLWLSALEHGFSEPLFASFKQWKSIGANVRRGEKATYAVFYRSYESKPDPRRDDDNGKRRVARFFPLFNIDQVDGVLREPPAAPITSLLRYQQAEAFISNTGARIVWGGDRACYRPASDTIHMPDRALFTGTTTMPVEESILATELHELFHWTLPSNRCNRPIPKTFGDEVYQREEMAAEIASAMLCAELQISSEIRDDHIHYITHWRNQIAQDSKAIFRAAAKASEGIKYLHSLQPYAMPADESCADQQDDPLAA